MEYGMRTSGIQSQFLQLLCQTDFLLTFALRNGHLQSNAVLTGQMVSQFGQHDFTSHSGKGQYTPVGSIVYIMENTVKNFQYGCL